MRRREGERRRRWWRAASAVFIAVVAVAGGGATGFARAETTALRAAGWPGANAATNVDTGHSSPTALRGAKWHRGEGAAECWSRAALLGAKWHREEGASGCAPRVESSARADGGARGVSLVAEVSCDPLPGPGKVQCIVRVRPVGGMLGWSDAIVLSAPPFAPPLRTRVAVGDAKRNDAEGADFSLALAATGDGVGELKVLARATVCGDGGCRPVQAEAVARVRVGASGSGAR